MVTMHDDDNDDEAGDKNQNTDDGEGGELISQGCQNKLKSINSNSSINNHLRIQ